MGNVSNDGFWVSRAVICLSVALFCGCSVSREYGVLSHKEDVYFYSTEREEAIGKSIAKEVKKEFQVSVDPIDMERVERVIRRIAAVSDRQEVSYHAFVINKEDVKNAFSLPGGYVYVFKDLLDALKTDDELAFVIAHELGHIVARHHIKRLQAAWSMNLLILASATQAKDSPDLLPGLSGALTFILSGFSQKEELEADSLAVKYTQSAGYKPESAVSVLDKLWQFKKKERTYPYSYVKTHPDTGLRIKSVKESLGLPLEFKDYINGLN